MKKRLLSALLLGSVSVAEAQVSAPTLKIDRGKAAQDFSTTSAARATLLSDLAPADTSSSTPTKSESTLAPPVVATPLPLPLHTAQPPAPPPRPQFLYGGRDDYRLNV